MNAFPLFLLFSPLQSLPAELPVHDHPLPAPESQPASLVWGDWNSDPLTDALVLREGEAVQLLHQESRGVFADVSARAGLIDYAGVRQAAWNDFDLDGRADLLLVAPGDEAWLLRNTQGGLFADAGADLALEGTLSAEWHDFDADGRLDLVLVTDSGERLLRNLGDGSFDESLTGMGPVTGGSVVGGPPATGQGSNPFCARFVHDMATDQCVQTSSVPTLGMLYPLGPEFNVNSAGRVGIGTLSPAAVLHVAGDIFTEGPLISNFSSGPPFSVVSSTRVPNLNADRLDGLHASAFSQLGNSIGTNEIENGAVTTAKLADSAVVTSKIANSAVTGTKIANNAITSNKLQDGVVTSAKIAGDAVSSLKIANLSVANQDIANNAINSSKIANGTVTGDDLADGTIGIADLGPLSGTGSATGLFRVNASGSSATAIYGDVSSGSGVTVGVRGVTASTSGRGVYGLATATSGVNYGLYGATSSNAGNGVFGVSTASSGSGRGVVGRTLSSGGAGVYGYADSQADGAPGLMGQTFGHSTGTAIQASSSSSFGPADGVRANTDSSAGWAMWALANTAGGRGVVGQAPSGGSAVHANGDLNVSGSKNFVQAHPSDPSKEIRFSCLEGNEAGTYFRGSAEVIGGLAVIEVPEEFRLVSLEEGMTVQLTPYGPARMWVESRDLDRVVVRADLDVAFDYQVYATRRGFADFQALQANQSFVPRFRGVPYGEFLPQELRDTLVTNGILNVDYTPNEATAAALGWELVEPSATDRLHLFGGAAESGLEPLD